MNKDPEVTIFKIAVIVGEQVRNAEENMANILSFLDMFGVPYHIYACVDKNGKHIIKKYKNVKRVVSYDQVESDPVVRENTKLCTSFMKRGGWQFIKCNIAADMIQEPTEYTHMIKLRTDSVYRWNALFTKMFPGQTEIKKRDIINVRKMFQLFLGLLTDFRNNVFLKRALFLFSESSVIYLLTKRFAVAK